MKKRCHSEADMVKAVKELEGGLDADTVARTYNVSKGTLYNWKSKYSGMEVRQIERLHTLESEVSKYKQMYAELSLELKMLKDVLEKKN